ncbi:exodeoxyribonuclease III [bacterium]|nr:exodeoxyribonuclease III [bacterium]
MKKILSYNVNGIRAALRKGLADYLLEEDADVVCFQELKAMEDQIDPESISALTHYHKFYFSAEKKGYSGVGIYSKEQPVNIVEGCGHELFDKEGRVLRLDFEDYSVISAYFPSGTTGDIRQDVKYDFLDYFFEYTQKLRNEIPNLIVCGDYNICNKPIDIHNPVSNKNSSGFLPEEREWMDKWFENNMIDSFRAIHGDKPDQYTWWSFRANARANNKGWRIDYISVANTLKDKLVGAEIRPSAVHSDHCPIYAVLDL